MGQVEGVVPAVPGLGPSVVGERITDVEAVDDHMDDVAVGALFRQELYFHAARDLLAGRKVLVE
jgi:hypothetical protein